jgi:hypothetical protein
MGASLLNSYLWRIKTVAKKKKLKLASAHNNINYTNF